MSLNALIYLYMNSTKHQRENLEHFAAEEPEQKKMLPQNEITKGLSFFLVLLYNWLFSTSEALKCQCPAGYVVCLTFVCPVKVTAIHHA